VLFKIGLTNILKNKLPLQLAVNKKIVAGGNSNFVVNKKSYVQVY